MPLRCIHTVHCCNVSRAAGRQQVLNPCQRFILIMHAGCAETSSPGEGESSSNGDSRAEAGLTIAQQLEAEQRQAQVRAGGLPACSTCNSHARRLC